jgi:uncharacterized membrane protein
VQPALSYPSPIVSGHWRTENIIRHMPLVKWRHLDQSPGQIKNISGIVMEFTPVTAIHTTFALCAVALGPIALWSRLSLRVRPRWHRAAGYAWVTCMLGTALSALFIQSHLAMSWQGYSPIHLLIGVTVFFLWRSFTFLNQGNTTGHRRTMQSLYLGACVVTGLFTLLPGRALGQLLWGQWLGWL